MTSAGILFYKKEQDSLKVLLVHPGGPYFKNKGDGWWMLPKGALEPGERALPAAWREFQEETGILIKNKNEAFPLGFVKQKGGKTVFAWAVEAKNGEKFKNSITFEMEWPPRSGRKQKFPENDRGEFFALETAYKKILPSQKEFLDRLTQALNQ